MNNRFFVILIQGLLIITILSCAKRGRPTGGPEDKDPPIMESARPANETTNFSAKEIRIYFNEYIKLKELNKQLVVSPPLKYQPIITPLGTPSKYIKIKILDTLKENTTYTLNFGQSIIDNSEGNILNNFRYVFSTGDVIDSLKISGTIKDAFNEVADKNVSVMLYNINEEFQDSIIYKEKPFYVANTLDTVAWDITNIKEGKYLLVALNDKSKNYIFDPKEDKIGYYSEEISIPTEENYEISLFQEILEYKLVRPTVVSKSHILFGYEGIGDSIKIRPMIPDSDLISQSIFEKEKDTLNYWYKGISKDSLQFLISNKEVLDTVVVRAVSKIIDSLELKSSFRGILPLREQFRIGSNIPLASIDTSKISFITSDSIKVPYSYRMAKSLDSINFYFKKEHNTEYRVQLLPGSVTDFLDNVNDTLSIGFGIKQPSDYGSVYFKLQNVKSYPVIVEMIDSKGELVESIYAIEPQEFAFLKLVPAKYNVRIIYDTNANGKWDTGSFLQKIQPEQVIYYPKEIEVRANWDPTETFILKE